MHAFPISVRGISLIIAIPFFLVVGCGAGQKAVKTASGLTYTTLRAGSGPVAQSGQQVAIHEIVTFQDGKLFFTTRKGKPIRINLGANQIIKGLEEGIIGMRVGELRQLIVPPSLSQRTQYPKGLDPDDVLIYEVELISIEATP